MSILQIHQIVFVIELRKSELHVRNETKGASHRKGVMLYAIDGLLT